MNPRFCLFPALFLASCATAPETPVEPIEPIECLAVHYDARLSTSSAPVPDGEGQDEKPDVTVPRGDPLEGPDSTLPSEIVEIDCRMLNLSRERAWQWLSRCDSRFGANRLQREVAEEQFDTLAALPSSDEYSFPRLSLYPGQRGNLTISNQRAYIESFQQKVSMDGNSFVVDPIVSVASDGLNVDFLVGELDGNAPTPLDLTLHLAEIQQPQVTARGRLPGSEHTVTVEVPLYATQRLQLATVLGKNEALVIGAIPVGDPERTMLVLVTAETYVIEDHDEVETAVAR